MLSSFTPRASPNFSLPLKGRPGRRADPCSKQVNAARTSEDPLEDEIVRPKMRCDGVAEAILLSPRRFTWFHRLEHVRVRLALEQMERLAATAIRSQLMPAASVPHRVPVKQLKLAKIL